MRNTGFSSDFGKSHNTFKKIFWGMFAVVGILIVIQWGVIGYLGVKAIDEVQENNGSIATTMGAFYKDFKEASRLDDE